MRRQAADTGEKHMTFGNEGRECCCSESGYDTFDSEMRCGKGEKVNGCHRHDREQRKRTKGKRDGEESENFAPKK